MIAIIEALLTLFGLAMVGALIALAFI